MATVFVPTNAAFEAVLSQYGITTQQALSQPSLLKGVSIVTYIMQHSIAHTLHWHTHTHTVPGCMTLCICCSKHQAKSGQTCCRSYARKMLPLPCTASFRKYFDVDHGPGFDLDHGPEFDLDHGTGFVCDVALLLLLQLLQYHIVPNMTLTTSDIKDGQTLATALSGQTLKVSIPAGVVEHVACTQYIQPVLPCSCLSCSQSMAT